MLIHNNDILIIKQEGKMPKGKKQNFTASLKKKVAIEAIKGEKTTAQISSEYQVFPARIHEWKKQLLERCEELFSPNQTRDKNSQNQILLKDQQIEQLQRKIGELVVENDFYKKKFLL